MLIDSVIQGGVGIASGIIGHKKRKAEQATAQTQYDQNMTRYQSQDLSNPYANMENVYEDLTVNTQAADFAAQQQSQGMANTMQSMKGAAGGSGIAALAQSMANSQAQQTQQASASIAQQESKNQVMAAQGENQRQMAMAQGEEKSRQMQADKVGTQMGMAQSRLTAANEARAAAKADLVGGIGDMVGGGAAAAVGSDPTILDGIIKPE